MGIQNLLPFVKKACREGNINEFGGQSIAVDVSCLLHRGIFGCMDKIAQGHNTDFYVSYVIKYVQKLLSQRCHVVLVFDGRALPAKKSVNDSRREKRQANRARGHALLAEGKQTEAYDYFRKSAAITFDMIQCTIQACRKLNNVDVVVAPYESDAQLTYLSQQNLVHAVFTEDSDLIAFGCEKIIFKMDPGSGACVVYDKAKLPLCQTHRALTENFDFVKFRRICILSGCDYLEAGLPGVGLKKASEFFAKTSCSDLAVVLPRIPRYLNLSLKKISPEFIDDFIRAENTFLYQVVFDPRSRRQLPLNPYEEDGEGALIDHTKLPYAGTLISDHDEAMQLALGNRDHGGSIVDNYRLPSPSPSWSIWNSNFAHSSPPPIRVSPQKIRTSLGAFSTISPTKRTISETQLPNKRLRNSPAKPPPNTLPRKRSPMSSYTWATDDLMKIYGVALPTDVDGDSAKRCNGGSQPPVVPNKSPYFAAVRSSTASNNPFKKPRISAPAVVETDIKESDDGGSLLDEIEKKEQVLTSLTPPSSQETCRESGLTCLSPRQSVSNSGLFAQFQCKPVGLTRGVTARNN